MRRTLWLWLLTLCVACGVTSGDRYRIGSEDASARDGVSLVGDAALIDDATPVMKKVAFLGDSLTAGFNGLTGGYRADARLVWPPHERVGSLEDTAGPHDGWSGNGFVELIRRAREMPQADVVYLMAGTAQSVLEARGELPASSTAVVVDVLQERGMEVVLMLPPPIEEAPKETILALYRAEQRQLIEERGLRYVDLYTDFPSPGTADNVHPSEPSYTWMGARVSEVQP